MTKIPFDIKYRPQIEWKMCSVNPKYEVSSDGRVRNKKRGNILKNRLTKFGYLEVYLSDPALKKGGRYWRVHRLVAMAFISNPEGKPHIDHIDGNRVNNCVSNLRWCTNDENHAFPLAIQRKRYGHKNMKAVAQYTKDSRLVAKYNSIKEAYRETGICPVTIRKCAHHEYGHKTAGNYYWEFI